MSIFRKILCFLGYHGRHDKLIFHHEPGAYGIPGMLIYECPHCHRNAEIWVRNWGFYFKL